MRLLPLHLLVFNGRKGASVRPPPLCPSSVTSVTQSSFRLLRPLHLFAANPPPSAPVSFSPLRSLRSLLSKILPCVPCVPWANPQSAGFRRSPAAIRPPPSALRDASTTDMRVGPPFPVAKPNLHLPTLEIYFYNSDTPTITGKERGPWSLTVDFGDTCLFHDENSLSSRYSTVVWTTAKIRTRRRVHRDNESPKGRGNALSAAGLKTRQTPLGRS